MAKEESTTERMRKKVGEHSHKDCRNTYCSGNAKGKQRKTEHIFIEESSWGNIKWGWKCMACGTFTKVY